MPIFLIGYMGCGKSTIGRKLAKKLNYDFIDVDDFIETRYRISIPSFFEQYGEGEFRNIERLILSEIIQTKDTIISCGGGLPCFFDNMDKINNTGLSIYIKMHQHSLADRLRNAKRKRPLLKTIADTDLEDFICEQLTKREPYYSRAHIIAKGENIDIDNLLEAIKEYKAII